VEYQRSSCLYDVLKKSQIREVMGSVESYSLIKGLGTTVVSGRYLEWTYYNELELCEFDPTKSSYLRFYRRLTLTHGFR
jgi:hypothetical protein